MSPARIHHCAQSSRVSAPRAEGFGFLKAPEVACSPKQCCLGKRHPQGGSSQVDVGVEAVLSPCLDHAADLQGFKREPCSCSQATHSQPQPGKGTFQEVHGSGAWSRAWFALLSSPHSQCPQHKVSTLASNPRRKRGHGLVMEQGTRCFNFDVGLPLLLNI